MVEPSELAHRGACCFAHHPPYCCMASDLHLVDWFTAHNGTFDRSALAFAQIDSLGRGAFALRDLQVQPHLFFFLASAGNTVNSSRCDRSKATRCSPCPAISLSQRAPLLSPL